MSRRLAVLLFIAVFATALPSFGGRGTRAQTRQLSERIQRHRRSRIKTQPARWLRHRKRSQADTGLRDHASRHSSRGAQRYLERGQENVARGHVLKGGGSYPDRRYYIRRIGKNEFSMTITNSRDQIHSIDTWKRPGQPLRREDLERGLRNSGVTPPKRFWQSL